MSGGPTWATIAKGVTEALVLGIPLLVAIVKYGRSSLLAQKKSQSDAMELAEKMLDTFSQEMRAEREMHTRAIERLTDSLDTMGSRINGHCEELDRLVDAVQDLAPNRETESKSNKSQSD